MRPAPWSTTTIWEDGYEPSIDSPVQITTQVWGDGNPANGSAPGFVGDTLAAGDVILLYNQLNSTTLQAVLDYDGRDKIGASKAISVTRTGWSTGPETLMAGAIEVFSSNVGARITARLWVRTSPTRFPMTSLTTWQLHRQCR